MNRRKRYSIFSIAILAAFFSLCAGTERDLYALCCGSDLGDISYTAGDMLESNLLYALDRTLPILSTSFVNLDNLKETSAFGKLIGEQIASRFSQHGYRVKGALFRSTLRRAQNLPETGLAGVKTRPNEITCHFRVSPI